MDRQTANILNEMNMRFYADNAQSFSKTRMNPWKGWERLVPYIEGASTILDVACGNMRFERFVQERCPSSVPEYYCIDACPELVGENPEVSFQRLDIVELCISGNDVAASLNAPTCDFVVSFGFLHHIPSVEARIALVKALVEKTRTGGTIALSFWQFMNDKKLALKAEESTEKLRQDFKVNLDKGDYLLGWQDVEGACRYCHHFDDSEICELIATFGRKLEIIEQYSADGNSIPLNSYLILRKH